MRSINKKRIKLGPPASSVAVVVVLLAWSSRTSGGVAMPDFSLRDVNASSVTYGQWVSPRNYLQQVSGWYFGHAT